MVWIVVVECSEVAATGMASRCDDVLRVMVCIVIVIIVKVAQPRLFGYRGERSLLGIQVIEVTCTARIYRAECCWIEGLVGADRSTGSANVRSIISITQPHRLG